MRALVSVPVSVTRSGSVAYRAIICEVRLAGHIKGCMSRARDIQGFVRYMQHHATGAPYERSILAVIMRTTFGAGSKI